MQTGSVRSNISHKNHHVLTFLQAFLAEIMSSTLTWRPTEAEEANSRYHNIDGPQINALQMVSEALDIPQQDDMPEDENSQFDVVDEGGRSQPPSTPFTFGNRTIVAADNEVSNGFVKSGTGKSLPYVFEANESGK